MSSRFGGEPLMDARPSVLQGLERRARGEVASTDGKPQTISGHRIDEPSGVSGEDQPIELFMAMIDGQRTEHHRGADRTAPRKPIAQVRLLGDFPEQKRLGISKFAVAAGSRLHDTNIRQPAGNRGDADVAPAPDVHLTEGGSIRLGLEVRPNRPSTRTNRMACQAKAECERRPSTVGGDGHARPNRSRPAGRTRHDAIDDGPAGTSM
jgi:hypothetical protein